MSNYGTYEDFTAVAWEVKTASRGALRWGQALSNTLYQIRPDLYEQVREAGLDPFYADAGAAGSAGAFLIEDFENFVRNRW